MRDDDRPMTTAEFRLAVMHVVRQGFTANAAELGTTPDALFREIVCGLIGLRPLTVDNVGAICPGCHATLAAEIAGKRDEALRQFVREIGEEAVCDALGIDADQLKRQMGQ